MVLPYKFETLSWHLALSLGRIFTISAQMKRQLLVLLGMQSCVCVLSEDKL